MDFFDLTEQRRRWQGSNIETLVVAVTAAPRGPDPAEFCLELGWELLEQHRRTLPNVVLWEADFWAPTLCHHLPPPSASQDNDLPDFVVPTRNVESEERDLLKFFQSIAGNYELREKLRPNRGTPQSEGEREQWRHLAKLRLEPVRPEKRGERSQDQGELLAFPARTSSFERLDHWSPDRLVKYQAEGPFLPGVAVARALLAITSPELRAGIALLNLPTTWNHWSLMIIGQVADVLIVLTRGDEKHREADYLRAMADFIRKRRQAAITRPSYEEDIGFSEDPPMPEVLKDVLREVPDLTTRGKRRGKARSLRARRLAALAADLDLDAAGKSSGLDQRLVQTTATTPDEDLAQELKKQGETKIRILVESGAYGEEPLRRLGRATQSQTRIPGFEIETVGITHQDLFEYCHAETARRYDPDSAISERYSAKYTLKGEYRNFLKYLEDPRDMNQLQRDSPTRQPPIDLMAFPYYMLGALAEEGIIHPLHVLEDELKGRSTRCNLTADELEQGFHKVNETCRYHGVLFAVPYIFTQKVLLAKIEKERDEAPGSWEELERKLTAWQEKEGEWRLLLETDPKHVGAWYDWLEMVFAHDSNDFLRAGEKRRASIFRGSDYGDCQLTDHQTLRATRRYLDFLIKTKEQLQKKEEEEVDWDHILELFMDEGKSKWAWATVVWSDVAAYHWRKKEKDIEYPPKEEPIGLEGRVRAYPFPLAEWGRGRLSVEGWVLGVPTYVKGERLKLAAQFLAWFLDPQIQVRFARVGGSTARRDIGHALGEIQRLVDRTIVSSWTPPALKITFREAPAVIERMRHAIAEKWIEEYGGSQADDKFDLKFELEKLAEEIIEEVLKNKARNRDQSYWADRRRWEQETQEGQR